MDVSANSSSWSLHSNQTPPRPFLVNASSFCAEWPVACTRGLGILDDITVARGVEWRGSDARLYGIKRALEAGRAIAVAALGGSISAGSAYSVKRSERGRYLFHAQLVDALQHRFPRARHLHHNGAIPATGPAFFELCLDHQLPRRADQRPLLVLLEFACNLEGWQDASFERLLRALLRRLGPLDAIIVVNAHTWRCGTPTRERPHQGCPSLEGVARNAPSRREEPFQLWDVPFAFARDNENMVAAVCRQYDIPLVSMRAALLTNTSEPQPPPAGVPLGSFMQDKRHPNAQGHTFLAQLVLARLLAARGPTMALRATEEAAAGLPSPLLPEGRELLGGQTSSLCARGAQLSTFARPRGFLLDDEGRGASKRGFVALEPGASVRFSLGSSLAAFGAARRTQLFLGYLRSYAGMGRAAYACVGAGCRCESGTLEGHHRQRTSVTTLAKVALDRRGVNASSSCELRLEVLPSTSSGAHKFKVLSLLLAPTGLRNAMIGVQGAAAHVGAGRESL